jgi:hypothetical protein
VTIGYIVIACLIAVIAYNFFKKTISIEWYMLIISFLSMFVLVRYTRTPLFDSYLAFMHLFVIMLTGWTIFNIYKRNIFLGLLLLAVVIIGSIKRDIKEINGGTNDASMRAESWKNLLASTYPGKNFSIYDNSYRSTGFSLPLVLFLDAEGKISDKGYKIGFGSKQNVSIQPHKEIKGNKVGFILRDLNSSSSAELSKDGWGLINPSQIYRSTVEWYKK